MQLEERSNAVIFGTSAWEQSNSFFSLAIRASARNVDRGLFHSSLTIILKIRFKATREGIAVSRMLQLLFIIF